MIKKTSLVVNSRFEIEKDLLQKFNLIAGVDEAGRGALAGPVVSAMVILNPDYFIKNQSEINDSKKLSPQKRLQLVEEIKNHSLAYIVSEIGEKEIDEINILSATKKSVIKSWESITIKPNCLILDALKIPEIPIPQFSFKKGDSLSYSIAAASILAKTHRDSLMIEWDQKYPEYEFKKNKGYGVKLHLEKIKQHGPCPIHRKTFAPIKNWF